MEMRAVAGRRCKFGVRFDLACQYPPPFELIARLGRIALCLWYTSSRFGVEALRCWLCGAEGGKSQMLGAVLCSPGVRRAAACPPFA